MHIMTEDGFTLLLAGIVRQAVEDWRDGYTHPNRPDAATFLREASLMDEAGTLDARFTRPTTRTGRPSHDGQYKAA
jgi:hypothetical protein